MTNRRRFTAEFKARVALEALRGDKTIQQIAAQAQGASEPGERPGSARRWTVWAKCFRTVPTALAGIMNPRSATFTPRSAS